MSLDDPGEGGIGGGDGDDNSGPGGGDSGEDDGGGEDDGDGGGDEPGDAITGIYRVQSTMDLSSSPIVQDLAGDALGTINDLANDPVTTLMDLLESANVPILDQLLALLPDLLLEPFKGFVNDFVLGQVVGSLPFRDQVLAMATDLTTLLTQFDLVSQFELTSVDQAGGVALARHTLSGVEFHLDDQDLFVDTPELVDQITTASDVTCSVALGEYEGSIQVGDHAFGLPLGGFVLDGLNQSLLGSFGLGDVRGTLGALFDCPALAEDVSSRCLGILCVGNRDQIEAFCEAGLDQAAARIENSLLTALDLAEVRLEAGDAILRDDGEADGLVDLLDQGNWQTIVVVDGVELPFAAAFVGRRVGD